MNAIQFIKENGVEKAREVVSGAPEGATHLSDDACHYVNADFKPLPAHIKEQLPELIVIDDLKRLVESVDLIKSYGGIINAKHDVKYLDLDWDYDTPRVTRLKQAIADYESIYGVSMFKVGDFVLPISNEFSNEVCELTEDYVGQDFKYKTKKGGFGYIVKSFMPTAWRHATPEEIAAGHRIDHFVDINDMVDCEILDYPEDYTSPNCKKFDERVK